MRLKYLQNNLMKSKGALFKPARQPLTNWIRLHLPPLKILMMKSTARPPPMQPRRVLVMASATTEPSPAEEIRPCEPPLNAKKPKMRMNAPRLIKGTE